MKNFLKKLFLFSPPPKPDKFRLEKSLPDDKPSGPQYFMISPDIDKNLAYIKKRFSIPLNNDLILREITLEGGRRAFFVLIDGMVDSKTVDLAVIEPLLHLPLISGEAIANSREDIMRRLIAHCQGVSSFDIEDVVEDVNFGSCALFVDGIDCAFIMDVRNWEHRSITRPETEQSIYGPQEAFSEMLRTNSALVRKILKTEHLICESVKIGSVSKTRGVFMYIDNIANKSLIDEVRSRINGIDMDYVISIEEVSLMLEDKTFMITNQILATERPDRAARALSEGRVVLMLNGSPRVLIFPTNAFEMTHSAADAYMRVPFANMTRIIRLLSMFVSILLPGLYLAITLFHQELIPTYLLYSISASRENVPFPSILEMILMDLSFEMIREAGIRMPGPIGSTLGIVGGLILGQAAVSAKIVSPIMIIVIAITGIGSFATSDYSLGWSYRILRIIFMFLGAVCGFYGIALGIFVYAVHLASQKSFGIPFLAPLPKGGWKAVGGTIFVKPIWKDERRPEFLDPLDDIREPRISRRGKRRKKQ